MFETTASSACLLAEEDQGIDWSLESFDALQLSLEWKEDGSNSDLSEPERKLKKAKMMQGEEQVCLGVDSSPANNEREISPELSLSASAKSSEESFPTLRDVIQLKSRPLDFKLKFKCSNLMSTQSPQPPKEQALIRSERPSEVPQPSEAKDGGAARKKRLMEKFSNPNDFKHVVYNLLVDNYNEGSRLVEPCQVEVGGKIYQGFVFNEDMHPEKKIPELYSENIRKDRLDLLDYRCVCIQDLYKFYLRACLELLAKYFIKHGKYTFLYPDVPLFISGGSLEDAVVRIKKIKPKKNETKRKRSREN